MTQRIQQLATLHRYPAKHRAASGASGKLHRLIDTAKNWILSQIPTPGTV